VKVEPGIGAAAATVKREECSSGSIVPPRPAWAVFDEDAGQDGKEEPYPKFAQPVRVRPPLAVVLCGTCT
jgi:hypothetical protein